MWISKVALDLIKQQSQQFRQWHEERMLEKNREIDWLRGQLQQKFDTYTPIMGVQHPVPIEYPTPDTSDWMAALKKQIDEQEEPDGAHGK